VRPGERVDTFIGKTESELIACWGMPDVVKEEDDCSLLDEKNTEPILWRGPQSSSLSAGFWTWREGIFFASFDDPA